ncbi:MAG: cell division protein SepF [Oscillospiraceae bacterium]|nr:cell division protein SepF [Oscillospiraceae bacterium]
MVTMFEKAKDFLLGNDVEADYEDYTDNGVAERSYSFRKDKVVSMPANHPMQIVGFRPTSFKEIEEIANSLKERKAVLFDVTNVKNTEDARRIVDFIAGVVMGIDGDMKKLTDGIFSAAPSNVSLEGDFVSDTVK